MDEESHQPIVATNVHPVEQEKRVVVVTYQDVPPSSEVDGSQISCAVIGLIFSWIPIVGLITFCVNCDAPRGSVRYSIASAALMISILVLLFNLLFWSIFLR